MWYIYIAYSQEMPLKIEQKINRDLQCESKNIINYIYIRGNKLRCKLQWNMIISLYSTYKPFKIITGSIFNLHKKVPLIVTQRYPIYLL